MIEDSVAARLLQEGPSIFVFSTSYCKSLHIERIADRDARFTGDYMRCDACCRSAGAALASGEKTQSDRSSVM